MPTFQPPPEDDARVEKLVLGVRPNMTWYGVLAYRARNAVFSARYTDGTKSIHSWTSRLTSRGMALCVRTSSRISLLHVPFDQGNLATAKRLSTWSGCCTAFITRVLNSVYVCVCVWFVPLNRSFHSDSYPVHANPGLMLSS